MLQIFPSDPSSPKKKVGNCLFRLFICSKLKCSRQHRFGNPRSSTSKQCLDSFLICNLDKSFQIIPLPALISTLLLLHHHLRHDTIPHHIQRS
eukprot:CCRYP_010364-RD/>CCRYP_010364-RD protein AED:0.14 eAED:0.14 QI:1102/0.8/0.83/1/0.6/0.5/6/0/92